MQIKIKKIKILYVFLLAIIVLMIPHLLRYFNGNILIGGESYYHAKIVKDIIDGNFQSLNPYHYILAFFTYIFGDFASKLLPFLLGIFSLLLFYLILKKYFNEEIFLILFILILSPDFIYTFTISNIHSFFIFISLLFYYFLKNKKRNILSITILLFLIYTLSIYNYNAEFPDFLEKNIIKDAVTEIGALIGFGIFNLLLALIGIILSWEYKKKIYPVYLIILILIISYYYIGNIVNIYLNFFLAIFAGIALYRLINLKWESKSIKNLTLIILIIGLFFSCISYISILSNSLPDKEIIDALEYLRDLKKDNVLSDYKNGFWIEYYGKKSIMNSNFNYTNVNEIFKDIDFIFMSNDLEKTKKVLDRYNIGYIFITPEMKKKKMNNKEEGLLFLFRNKETFKNIYKWDDVEIWEVIKKEVN